jgi:hypothetical protein
MALERPYVGRQQAEADRAAAVAVVESIIGDNFWRRWLAASNKSG